MAKKQSSIAAETTANPAPLGLLAFGMTTVLLNLHNVGLFAMNTMILGMGIFFGGIAQIIAGIMEWKKGNTFGMTAFISFGAFWLSLAALLIMPAWDMGAEPSHAAMASYLIMWGIYTLVMFFATLRINLALQVVFGTLAVLFFLLALNDITGSILMLRIAGIEGIICGLTAVYAGLAQVLNETYGRTILPLCPVK